MLSLQPTIAQVYRVMDHPEGVGIEIEAEGFRRLTPYTLDHWTTTPDGSLRDNGIEFVSTILDGEYGVRRAIRELRQMRNTAYEYNMSWRCGTHVHLSVTSLTVGQYVALLALYAAVEPAFFAICGEERNDNVFCVPWYHTPRNLQGVRTFMNRARALPRSRIPIREMTQHANKYQALNILPTRTLGTVELRMAPGWENIRRVQDFAFHAIRLRQLARDINTVDAVAEFLHDVGGQGVADAIGIPVTMDSLPMHEEALDTAFSLLGDEPIRSEDIDWSLPDVEEVAVPVEVTDWRQPRRNRVRTRPRRRATAYAVNLAQEALDVVDDYAEDVPPELYEDIQLMQTLLDDEQEDME